MFRNDPEKSRHLVLTCSPPVSFSTQETKIAVAGGEIGINIVRKTSAYAKMQPWFRCHISSTKRNMFEIKQKFREIILPDT